MFGLSGQTVAARQRATLILFTILTAIPVGVVFRVIDGGRN